MAVLGQQERFSLGQRGSAEMLVIGLSAALILMVALPLVTDIRDQTDHGMQRMCVMAVSEGRKDISEADVIFDLQQQKGLQVIHTPQFCGGSEKQDAVIQEPGGK